MDADIVVGQPDFVSGTGNFGGRSAQTLSGCQRVFTDGKRLLVADTFNHRVLIWRSIPKSNFTPADLVLGQPDFSQGSANNPAISASTLNFPRGIWFDGKRLFIADTQNCRVLIWNSFPQSSTAPADVVLGQPDFSQSTPNNGGPNASSLQFPRGVFSVGNRLIVADSSNNRVLIWNSIPTSNNAPADVVLGQPDFTQVSQSNPSVNASSMWLPFNAASDGKKLFVADSFDNRILIWNSIPSTNYAPADIVIGQPDFTHGTANNGGLNERSFSNASSIFTDGKKLFIPDSTLSRLLIYDQIPTSNFASADHVLGQTDFFHSGANNGGRSAHTMASPLGVAFDGKRLFVSEGSNSRVLIYNLSSTMTPSLSPQFNQGKAVLGKVFGDSNENGVQDEGEKGMEGVKIVSDTGIYAITDEDGKYHFPYIETGQHILKIDASTIPEGSSITTESPRKIIVTEGILTKVSFGIKLPADIASVDKTNNKPLLKVSASQDALLLKPHLKVKADTDKDKITFTIDCNYFLFIAKSELTFYDADYKKIKTIPLPQPLPLRYEIPLSSVNAPKTLYFQLSVYDKNGKEDRTGISALNFGSFFGDR